MVDLLAAGVLILAAFIAVLMMARTHHNRAVGIDMDITFYVNRREVGQTKTYMSPDEETAKRDGATFLDALMHEHGLQQRIAGVDDELTPLPQPTPGWRLTRVAIDATGQQVRISVDMCHRAS